MQVEIFAIFSLHRGLSPTHTLQWPGRNGVQITCNTTSMCLSRATCGVPRGTKGQLSYYAGQSLNRIYFSFLFYWLKPLTDEGGEETGVPKENPWWQSSSDSTYKSPESQSPNRDSDPQSECDYRNGWFKKWSHMQKISPKMVKPRDKAGEGRRRRRNLHCSINGKQGKQTCWRWQHTL